MSVPSTGTDPSGVLLDPASRTADAAADSAVAGTQPARRLPRRPVDGRLVVAAALVLLVSALASAQAADTDSGYDLLGLLRAVGTDALRLRWQYAVIVLVLAGVHYLAAAAAARAAAGQPLPVWENVRVQLAASAANRITPAGLGGSALLARYLTRRGLSGSAAVGAVVALSVFGGLADLVVLALLVVLGHRLGVGSGSTELSLLAGKARVLTGPLHSWWSLAVLVAVVVAGLLARAGLGARLAAAVSGFLSPAVQLLRRPRNLLALLAASGSTTLVLAFAFAASTAMIPGPQPRLSAASLIVAFMVGSAAGNAVPMPAGLGSTEAALVSVLVLAGMPVGHAAEVVVINRLVTFWLPALIGVPIARRLRRSGLL
jgi:uncharacterized membrane protein YbhN (UPF0104 family)